MNSPPWLLDYENLTTRGGFVALRRTQIELTGSDRASFLHNLCTNEIKKLPTGSGREAFITSVQGKTLGHGFIFAEPEALIFDTVDGQSEVLLKHLDHYLVCEQVVLTDRTEEWCEFYLAGVEAEAIISRLWQVTLPAPLSHVAVDFGSKLLRIRRVDLTRGGGFLLCAEKEDEQQLTSQLTSAGIPLCHCDAFDAARIEQGTPLFARDISDRNLPQEIARDNEAISFVKGCYLGQETVARIDALGHVNKSLVGLRFLGEAVPPIGTELLAGELPVGQITSASFSPRFGSPLALGFVKHGQEAVGKQFSSTHGDAVVVSLPVA